MDRLKFSNDVSEKNFTEWDNVFEYLATNYDEYDKINPAVLVPASNLTDPESLDKFGSAEIRSLNLGAGRVYRDKNDSCSIQVRVYDGTQPIPHAPQTTYDQNMYHIQLNWHNPNDVYGALKHLFVDVLKIELPQIERKCN